MKSVREQLVEVVAKVPGKKVHPAKVEATGEDKSQAEIKKIMSSLPEFKDYVIDVYIEDYKETAGSLETLLMGNWSVWDMLKNAAQNYVEDREDDEDEGVRERVAKVAKAFGI